MTTDLATAQTIMAIVTKLRAFAISLSGNVDRAADLVPDTLMRSIANLHSFEPRTNMHA